LFDQYLFHSWLFFLLFRRHFLLWLVFVFFGVLAATMVRTGVAIHHL
jgi:hypothetical protein